MRWVGVAVVVLGLIAVAPARTTMCAETAFEVAPSFGSYSAAIRKVYQPYQRAGLRQSYRIVNGQDMMGYYRWQWTMRGVPQWKQKHLARRLQRWSRY